jgi:chemotaxis protein methyltransferase CheR
MANALSRAATEPESTFFAEQQALGAMVSHAMPALLRTRRAARTLRIWSVGCGTGQPTYSLAIALHERFPELSHWNMTIAASDVNADVLARARRGIYSDYEVQRGMTLERLERSFEQLPAGRGWRCRSPFSEHISWLQLDPLKSCTAAGTADLILCHQPADAGDLDPSSRCRRIGRLIDQLASDGYFILAAPEPALDRLPAFEHLALEAAIVYRRFPRETSLLSA